MASVEELYKNFGILADAGDKACEHEVAYVEILNAVKGGVPEKKLACQFIPRFSKHFSNIADQAIDAHIDLCEDEDVMIRRQAIRSLPDFCKENKETTQRIADVLTQLLQTEDNTEFTLVTTGLDSMMKRDPKGTLSGLFTQIVTGDETVRDSAIKYVNLAVLRLMKEVFHPSSEAEGFLYDEIKKVMSDVTGEEFKIFMNLLSKLKSIANNPQSLADVVAEQAELDKAFVASEVESIDRLITCTRQGIPFFLKGASSERFFDYIMKNAFPVLSQIQSPDKGVDYSLEILKLLSEISPYVDAAQSELHLSVLFGKLLDYMPLPPAELDTEAEKSPEKQLNFSYVECLLYATHQLGKKHEEFLNPTSNSERVQDFRLRLQYFSRQLQTYIRQLKASIDAKSDASVPAVVESTTISQAKLKALALRTCNNINILIKDLFHNPPSYKAVVHLSWTTPVRRPSITSTSPQSTKATPTASVVEEKRKRAGITPISFPETPSPDKKKKEATKVYQPPRNNSSNGSSEGSSWNSRSDSPSWNTQRRGRGRGRGQGRGNARDTQNFLYRS